MDTLLAFDLGYFAHRLAISEKSITGANDYSPTILYTDTGKKASVFIIIAINPKMYLFCSRKLCCDIRSLPPNGYFNRF